MEINTTAAVIFLIVAIILYVIFFWSSSMRPDEGLKIHFLWTDEGCSYRNSPGDSYFPKPISLARLAMAVSRTSAQTKDTLSSYLKDNWQVLSVGYNDSIFNGYYGAAFWNPKTHQVVIAHKGVFNGLSGLFTATRSLVFSTYSQQINSAITFTHKVLAKVLLHKSCTKGPLRVCITGFSLGGWLAQITTLTAEYLDIHDSGSPTVFGFSLGGWFGRIVTLISKYLGIDRSRFAQRIISGAHVHTVTFDSPGAHPMLRKVRKVMEDLEDEFVGDKIRLNSLDISNFVFMPNPVNTQSKRKGRLYQILPLNNQDEFNQKILTLNRNTSIPKWLKAFKLFNLVSGVENMNFLKDCLKEGYLLSVRDWPVIGMYSWRNLDKCLELLKDCTEEFQFRFWSVVDCSNVRYKTVLLDKSLCHMNVFSLEEKEYLLSYKEQTSKGTKVGAKFLKYGLPSFTISPKNYIQCKSEEDVNVLIMLTKMACWDKETLYGNYAKNPLRPFLKDPNIDSVTSGQEGTLKSTLEYTQRPKKLKILHDNLEKMRTVRWEGQMSQTKWHAGTKKSNTEIMPRIPKRPFLKDPDIDSVISGQERTLKSNLEYRINELLREKKTFILQTLSTSGPRIETFSFSSKIPSVVIKELKNVGSPPAFATSADQSLELISEAYFSRQPKSDLEMNYSLFIFSFLRMKRFSLMYLESDTAYTDITVLKIQSILNFIGKFQTLIDEKIAFKPYFTKCREIERMIKSDTFIKGLRSDRTNTKVIIINCSSTPVSDSLQQFLHSNAKDQTCCVKFILVGNGFTKVERTDSVYLKDNGIEFSDLTESSQKQLLNDFKISVHGDLFPLSSITGSLDKIAQTNVLLLLDDLVNTPEFWKNVEEKSPLRLQTRTVPFKDSSFSVPVSLSDALDFFVAHSEMEDFSFQIFGQERNEVEEMLTKQYAGTKTSHVIKKLLDSDRLMCSASYEGLGYKSLHTAMVFTFNFHDSHFSFSPHILRFCRRNSIFENRLLWSDDLKYTECFVIFSTSSVLVAENSDNVFFLKSEHEARKKFSTLSESLVAKNKNIHLFSDGYRNSVAVLFWKASEGSIENIRPFLFPDTEVFSEKEVLTNGSNLTIISGAPGSGKSESLEYILLSKTPCWKIYKHLREVDNFSTISNVNDLVNILFEDTGQEKLLVYALFKHCIQNTTCLPVMILLDGLDEVSQEKQSNVINMVKYLKTNTKARVLLTTRNCDRHKLENELGVVSSELELIGAKDQKNFFTAFAHLAYFCIHKTRCDSEHTENIVCNLINSVVDDSASFFGIPLHLTQALEILYRSMETLSTVEVNVSDLFAQLVHSKYDIYFSDLKNRVTNSKDVREMLQGEIETSLQDLAVTEVCGHSGVFKAKLKKETCLRFSNSVGLTDNNKFLHRAFAEYFFAQRMCSTLTSLEHASSAASLSHLIIKDILKGDNFRMTRTFLNQYFQEFPSAAKHLEELLYQSVTPYKLWEDDVKSCLDVLIKENQRALIRCVLHGIPKTSIYLDQNYLQDAECSGVSEVLKIPEKFSLLQKNEESYLYSIVKPNGAQVNFKDRNENPLLQFNVSIGNRNSVQALIKSGAGVNAHNGEKTTPLHVAASNRYKDISELPIAHGEVINSRNISEGTSLHVAASRSDVDCIKILTEKGANVNDRNIAGSTPLHIAAFENDSECVKVLIDRGSEVNACDNYHRTALHIASSVQNSACINLLIESGANINAKDENDCTPLHISVYHRSPSSAKDLIKQGADVNAVDKNGWTPLHIAVSRKSFDCVLLLHKHAADTFIHDVNGSIPLHIAVEEGFYNGVELLVCAQSSNALNKFAETPLHIAALKEDLISMRLLIENGASINLQDENGRIPLHISAKKGNVDCVKLLLENNSDINAQDNAGWSPLHYSAYNGKVECMKSLLFKGAQRDLKTKHGWTPIEIASFAGNRSCVTLLNE